MKILRYFFLAVTILSGFTSKAEANNPLQPIVITDNIDFFEIDNSYIQILEDPSLSLTLQDILDLPDDAYEPNHPLNNKRPKSAYWIKFRVKSLNQNKKKWVLEILDPKHNEIVLYSPDGKGGYQSSVTGLNYEFKTRTYNHKNFVIDLDLIPDKDEYYFLKIRSHVVGSFIFKIRTNPEFSSYAFNEYILLGVYYGILFIILIYNLILFFNVREKVYLYYFYYVLAWAWHSLLDDGIGLQYIWSGQPVISSIGFLFSRPLLLTCFVFYSLKFLEIKKKLPVYERYILGSLFLYLSASLLQVFLNFQINFLLNIFFITPFILIYYTSFKIYKSGYEPARFFILGNTFIVLGILVRILKDFGLVDMIINSMAVSIVAVYGHYFGMTLEIIILSLALADRIRFLKKEEEKAKEKIIEKLRENEILSQKVNRELETKVSERTKELMEKSQMLEDANSKLAKQAEEISRWNRILDLDNHKLKKNVKEVMEARIKSKDIGYEEFLQIFPDDLACMRYIDEIKWKDGYKCKKCGNEKFCNGSRPFSRRCTKCRYDESITAYTFLHKCKFPLEKAFYIIMKVNKYGEKVNCNEIARQLDMRKSTVWEFRKKILEELKERKISHVPDEDNLDNLILKV